MYQLHGITELWNYVSENAHIREFKFYLAKEVKVTLGRHIRMSPGVNPNIVAGIEGS